MDPNSFPYQSENSQETPEFNHGPSVPSGTTQEPSQFQQLQEILRQTSGYLASAIAEGLQSQGKRPKSFQFHKHVKSPKTFSGDTKNDACESWCTGVKNWIQFLETTTYQMEIPEDDKILLVGQYVEGHPSLWWHEQFKKAKASGTPRSLDDFLTGFKRLYTDPDIINQRRDKFETIVQKGSAQKYIRDLLDVARLLEPSPTAHEIIRQTRRGLKATVRANMDLQGIDPQTTSMEAYLERAVQIDNALYLQKNKPAQQLLMMTDDLPKKQQINLMKNNKPSHLQNRFKKNRGPYKAPKSLSSRKGNCYNCGKPGHYKSECPNTPKNGQVA